MICVVELELLLATFGMPWFRLVMLQVGDAIASMLMKEYRQQVQVVVQGNLVRAG
jgi:hypothetical protein